MAEENTVLTGIARLIQDLATKIEEDRKETDERFIESEERFSAMVKALRRDREASNPSRFSFSVAQDRGSEEESESSENRRYIRNTTVLHKQEKVDPAMVISVLSFPALKLALENQAQHEAIYAQFRSLGHFLSKDIRKALVENEARHHRNPGMTVSSILGQRDPALVIMFASLIRTREMGTKEGFVRVIGSSVPPLRASGRDPDGEMVIQDWDKRYHANVNKHVDILEKVIELAYVGATVRETMFWPKPVYGKDKDFGLLRVILKTFGRYQENFENYLTMDKLKTYTSTDELFRAVRVINDKNAAKAEQLRVDDAQIGKCTPLNDIFSEIESHRKSQTSILTRDGPRHANLPMTPFTGATRTGATGFQPRNFGGDRRQNQPGEHNRNRSYENFGRNARLRVELPEYVDLDDSVSDCVNPLFSPPPEKRGPDDQSEYESCWGAVGEDDTAVLSAAWQPNKPTIADMPKSLYDPKAKKTDPTKPCFRHFDGECPGKCGWSHDEDVMSVLGKERLASVIKSRFVSKELIKAEVAKWENRPKFGARVASFSVPTDLEQYPDSDYEYTNPGPSRIESSSQSLSPNPSGAGQEPSC